MEGRKCGEMRREVWREEGGRKGGRREEWRKQERKIRKEGRREEVILAGRWLEIEIGEARRNTHLSLLASSVW